MKTNDNAQQHTCGQNAFRLRFAGGFGAMLIMTALVIACCDVSLCSAAAQSDGAALYRKHCSTCHPQALTTGSTADLFGIVRTPPPGMPAYGEDKLSDLDVRAIGEYLFPAASGEPPAAASALRPMAQEPARTGSGTANRSSSSRSARKKRAWLRSFGTTED
ncbi:MAG: c-type cytochrome [Nitrospirota bacterium]